MASLFLVGVKVLIRNAAGEYLLVLSRDRGWEIPGGRVEEGEDLLAALHREVDEEIGVTIANERLAGVYTNQLGQARLLLWFLADLAAGTPGLSDEVMDVAWLRREELLERIEHPSFKARVEDMLNFDGRIVYRDYLATPYLKDLVYEMRREARF